jgi:hypothetical protein
MTLKTLNTLVYTKTSADSHEILNEELPAAEVFEPISEAVEMMVQARADDNNLSGHTILEQADVTNHTVTQGIASPSNQI